MKDVLISDESQARQKAKLLAFNVVGEIWLDNSLSLIVDSDIFQVEYQHNRFENFMQNYCTVFKKISINGRNYLIVKPKNLLKNVILNPQELLSERELQIAELVAYGKSNKQIAKKLMISEYTVSTHLRRIFAKLKVDSRAAMVYLCASVIRYLQKTKG